ncbi:MAG: hypothetical protein ACYCV0_12460 [Desulfitobacteriaceae bacterium]
MSGIMYLCYCRIWWETPSAANVIAISGLAERSLVYIGPVWNGPYAVISSVVLVGALFGMQGLVGWV